MRTLRLRSPEEAQAGVTSATQIVNTPGTQADGTPCKAFNNNLPVWSTVIGPKAVTNSAGSAAGMGPINWGASPKGTYSVPAATAATWVAPSYYNEYFSQQSWSAAAGPAYPVSLLTAQSGTAVQMAPSTVTVVTVYSMPASGAAAVGAGVASALALLAAGAALLLA